MRVHDSQVEDETDELLLWDEELAQLDPEDLPKRRLTDFSIYNAEVGVYNYASVMDLGFYSPRVDTATCCTSCYLSMNTEWYQLSTIRLRHTIG